jgi:hypothetical protein
MTFAPLSIAEAAALLAPMPARWWVAGGWAIDLFVGRTTRDHADLDIAMLRGDETALARTLRGWDMCIAHHGQLIEWSGDAPLAAEHHQLWCRSSVDGPWQLEVLLEDHNDDCWRYRRDHRITRELTRLGRQTSDGIPFIAPEIALLYKAKDAQSEQRAADFATAQRNLDNCARAWLRDALATAHPASSWLAML